MIIAGVALYLLIGIYTGYVSYQADGSPTVLETLFNGTLWPYYWYLAGSVPMT